VGGLDVTIRNYTSAGEQFSARLPIGSRQQVYPWPGAPNGTTETIADAGQEGRGLYAVVVVDPNPPDAYYQAADPPEVLAFVGTEYQPSGTVEERRQWATLTADDIRSRKNSEGEGYAQRVGFSSAQTSANPNVYILTRDIDLFFYSIVGVFYGDRLKDRTIGTDSTDPGTVGDPATYWPASGAGDVPIFLVNSNNGNALEQSAGEQDWGQVLKDVGTHILNTRTALNNYTTDVTAAYDTYVADPSEANRTALVSLDATDPSYGWPPFYVPA